MNTVYLSDASIKDRLFCPYMGMHYSYQCRDILIIRPRPTIQLRVATCVRYLPMQRGERTKCHCASEPSIDSLACFVMLIIGPTLSSTHLSMSRVLQLSHIFSFFSLSLSAPDQLAIWRACWRRPQGPKCMRGAEFFSELSRSSLSHFLSLGQGLLK